ncbi:MAG TPA: hypothetical protein VHB98_05920 [Chloroflexota bacterium]|jgi:hypothetical protein|nr:hypothetical protein [Chloroflexota bacterium]
MNVLTALSPVPDGADGTAGSEQWQLLREQAGVFIKSGMLPAHIKSPEQVIVIMLKGRELGLPPLYALSTIGVINGKPVVAAEVMASLVYRRHGDQALRIVQSDARNCTIEYRRRGWSEPQTYSFSIEDAHRAGLLMGNAWQKYPAAMLRARCISAVARMAFPDAISGVYTPEELGGSVQVIEDTVVPRVDEEPVSTRYTDRDLPAPLALCEPGARPPAATPSSETLERIARMRRVRAVWYGEDESLPAPRTQEDAEQAIAMLQGLLRLRVPHADQPLTPEQTALLREAMRDLAATGEDPGALPERLTGAQGYRLYKDLVRRQAALARGMRSAS